MMVRRAVIAALWLSACHRESEHGVSDPPQPPAIAPVVAATPPLDAPASDPAPDAELPPDAAPLDAAVRPAPMAHHKFMQLAVCPNGGYEVDFNCPEFLTTPGLPALDATREKVAVPWHDEVGLSTLPNLTVWILSASDGHKLETLPVWSYNEARAFGKIMEGTNKPEDMKRLVTAVEARAKKLDATLAPDGYQPIPACKPVESSSSQGMPYCGGFDRWTCGDLSISYRKTTHATLTLTKADKTSTIATTGWRSPSFTVGDADQKMKVGTLNCIVDARRIPDTDKVLVELEHVCDVGGDWCYVGGPTWQLAELP